MKAAKNNRKPKEKKIYKIKNRINNNRKKAAHRTKANGKQNTFSKALDRLGSGGWVGASLGKIVYKK